MVTGNVQKNPFLFQGTNVQRKDTHEFVYFYSLFYFHVYSLHVNPLARGPGEVKLDSDNFENYERICLNDQKIFLQLTFGQAGEKNYGKEWFINKKK